MFAGFLKNLIQDTGEQPGEEIHKTKMWEGPECRSVHPCGAGLCHPPGVDALASLESPQNPFYWDFLEASPIGMVKY